MANNVIMLKILRGDISSVLSVRPLNPITSVRQREISQNQRQCDHRSGDRSDEVTSHRKPVSFQSLKRQRKSFTLVPPEEVQPCQHFVLKFLSLELQENTFLLF